jgi:hypothetical protein
MREIVPEAGCELSAWYVVLRAGTLIMLVAHGPIAGVKPLLRVVAEVAYAIEQTCELFKIDQPRVAFQCYTSFWREVRVDRTIPVRPLPS